MPSAFIIINQTKTMKKKRITYGVNGMMEYQALIKIGRATLKVMFTDGSMTSIGQNPAKYTTSDFLVQHAIENSSDFKRGRIVVVNTIELDEEVHIERNPEKASTQMAKAAAKVAEQKPTETTPTPASDDADNKETADEPTEEAKAGEVEPAEEETPSDTEAEATPKEAETAGGKTEVEFTDNQEAKDYLLKNFGVKPGTMRNRDDIKAVGETYGVTITFANENK